MTLPTARPLVTELSLSDTTETTTSTNETTEEESHDIKEDGKQEELVGVVNEVTKDWSSKGEWLCPPYSYRQDENSVYFVLQTPGVKRPSMAKHFDEHQVSSVCMCVCVCVLFVGVWFYINFDHQFCC